MIRILHLYHDLMNLYGDYANVSALKRILEKSGEEVKLDRLSLRDTAAIEEYDFIFIGSGTERNMRVALGDLKKYSASLKSYIESGKPALFTGNSFEMLGKTVSDCRGKASDGLGFFDFTVTEQNKTRMTADVIYNCAFLTQPVVGFVNKCSEIRGVDSPVFEVEMGLGNSEGDKKEGARLNNFFGTHLTGPALIKNPHLLAYFAELILGKTPETDYLTYERAGYDVTLSELKKRAEA